MKYALCFAAFFLVVAASGQVSGPIMGLVPDSGTVRIMRGIPAAGNVDLPVDSGAELALVEPAPGQNFGLATVTGAGQVVLVSLSSDGTSAQSVPVAGATANPDSIVFSPNGTAAALWYSADQHAEVLTALTQTPADRRVDLSFLAGAAPVSMAVSDDGQSLVLATSSSVVYVGSTLVSLPVAGTPQAVAFFHGSNSVAAISDVEVVTFSDPGGAVVRTPVWSKPAGSGPNAQYTVGFGLSTNNSHLTITGNLGGVQTFDLINNNGTYTDCACAPSAFAHLGGTVFRLTGTESGPVKLYDAATGEILFVPATAAKIHRPIMRPTLRSGAPAGDQQQ